MILNGAVPIGLRLGSSEFSIRVRESSNTQQKRGWTSAPIGALRGAMAHQSFRDLESVLDKVNRYSTAGAQALAQKGTSASLGKALLPGFWAFFRTYVVRRGFLDGRMGLVLAISNAEGTYYRSLKLWLLQRPAARKEPACWR